MLRTGYQYYSTIYQYWRVISTCIWRCEGGLHTIQQLDKGICNWFNTLLLTNEEKFIDLCGVSYRQFYSECHRNDQIDLQDFGHRYLFSLFGIQDVLHVRAFLLDCPDLPRGCCCCFVQGTRLSVCRACYLNLVDAFSFWAIFCQKWTYEHLHGSVWQLCMYCNYELVV